MSGYPPADWLKQDKSAGIAVTLRLLTGANLLRLQCMVVLAGGDLPFELPGAPARVIGDGQRGLGSGPHEVLDGAANELVIIDNGNHRNICHSKPAGRP